MVELSDNQKVQPTFLYFWRVELFDYQKVQPINSMSYCHNVISIWVELSDNQKIQKFSLNFLIIRKFNHVWLNFLRLNFLTTSFTISISQCTDNIPILWISVYVCICVCRWINILLLCQLCEQVSVVVVLLATNCCPPLRWRQSRRRGNNLSMKHLQNFAECFGKCLFRLIQMKPQGHKSGVASWKSQI